MNKGYPPSIREIGEATDISSTSVVTYYLKQLEEWGYIERDAKFSRALRLSGSVHSKHFQDPHPRSDCSRCAHPGACAG